MKSVWLAAMVLCVCQIGCNKNGSPLPQEAQKQTQQQPQKTQQTVLSDNIDRITCGKHHIQMDGCDEYQVLSYDATWENGLGNQGAFVLERDGLTIHAHCGSKNCYYWSDGVGKVVIGDKSITDLITHYEPSCEDPLYVTNALEMYKQNFGRDGTVSDVCWQTLIVEKIEAKPTKN